MLKNFLGFELKKMVLPVAMLAVFFFVLLLKSPYAARFTGAAGELISAVLAAMNGFYSTFVTSLRPGDLITVTPLDDALFAMTLLISGYLLSSAILFLHRHNRAIYSRGNQMFLAVFLFCVLSFAMLNDKYLILNPYYTLGASFIIGYLITSLVWGVYDLVKMHEVMKRLKKQKKLARYFRREFNYLK